MMRTLEFLRSHALSPPGLVKFAIAMAVIVGFRHSLAERGFADGSPARAKGNSAGSRAGCNRIETRAPQGGRKKPEPRTVDFNPHHPVSTGVSRAEDLAETAPKRGRQRRQNMVAGKKRLIGVGDPVRAGHLADCLCV